MFRPHVTAMGRSVTGTSLDFKSLVVQMNHLMTKNIFSKTSCLKMSLLLSAAFSFLLPAAVAAFPPSASSLLDARRAIVQSRYDEDQRLLHTRKQSTSLSQILGSLQSGDILLIRSSSLGGSIAARAAEVPGQFSHLMVIAEHPSTKKLIGIDSDQGVGVKMAPIDGTVFAEYARVGLFRYKDTRIARVAAQNLLKSLIQRSKLGPIKYDNRMDLSDTSAAYCTELATWAFSSVGVQVPQHLSQVRFLNKDLREALGIYTDRIFLPQDLEVDSRFVKVKEWRNLDLLQSSYMSDAIFSQYFRWVVEGSEDLKPGLLNRGTVLLLEKLFPAKAASFTGEDIKDRAYSSGLLRYGISMYFRVNAYKMALKKELRLTDTKYFHESDYENLLEQLHRDHLLNGEQDPREDLYYGR